MSDHTDMSEIHNALKAIEAKLEKNANTLGWVLILTGLCLAVSLLALVLAMK